MSGTGKPPIWNVSNADKVILRIRMVAHVLKRVYHSTAKLKP